jgi:hypothetical protein
MHNLHIMVIAAESADEAMQAAEAHLAGWGDENNWRSIAGVIAEDGTWHDGNGDSQYSGPFTLEELNKELAEAIELKLDTRTRTGFAKLAEGDVEGVLEGKPADFAILTYRMIAFVEQLRAVYSAGLLGPQNTGDRKELPCVFTTRFRPGEFAEFGVTHLEGSGNRNEKKYAVLVDMHS